MIEYNPIPKIRIDELLDDLRFDIPGMSHDALISALRRSAIHMANAGNILRRKAQIFIEPCVENYLLEPIDCVDLVGILSVRNICGMICGEVTRLTQEPSCLTGCCGVTSWYEEPNEIWFRGVQCGQIFEVEFSVAPQYDACELDAVYRTGDYYEVLLAGARALAYDLPDKFWYDANKAEILNAKYEMGIRQLAVTSYLGHQRGVMRNRRPRVL